MDGDARPCRLRDLTRPIVRVRVHHQQFVDEVMALHQVLSSPADDSPDRFGLVERRQDQADGQAGLFLEVDQTFQVAEFAMMEVGFAEPALHP